jgi:hypothetical protein
VFVDIEIIFTNNIPTKMLKNYPPSFSKAVVTLLVILTLVTSCSKEYAPETVLNAKSDLLTGHTVSVSWSLNTAQVDNDFDTSVKGTVKEYFKDGTFKDSQGFVGYWTMVSKDSLIENTRSCVNPNATYFTNRFHIDYLDKGRLQLTYMVSDKRIRLVYEANK